MVEKTTDNKMKILSIYRSNYLAQHHVREIAKLTKKSHVTLLPHLYSLEKDKILISKVIGKNKVYSLNIDNILTINYILISELFESIIYQEQVFLIKQIITETSKFNLSGIIVLFGSYAKKTFHEGSDIDILYMGEIREANIIKIKNVGKLYGKTINIKTTALKNFENGLRNKDFLITEILKHHILLQNAELFVNALWKYYNEIKR